MAFEWPRCPPAGWRDPRGHGGALELGGVAQVCIPSQEPRPEACGRRLHVASTLRTHRRQGDAEDARPSCVRHSSANTSHSRRLSHEGSKTSAPEPDKGHKTPTADPHRSHTDAQSLARCEKETETQSSNTENEQQAALERGPCSRASLRQSDTSQHVSSTGGVCLHSPHAEDVFQSFRSRVTAGGRELSLIKRLGD